MSKNIDNSTRFTGFSELYDGSRPTFDDFPIVLLQKYLKSEIDVIADFGCGTGLSTEVLSKHCRSVIGVEPSEDMLEIAKSKGISNATFLHEYSHSTSIPSDSVDLVICSQSFHWMEPKSTLAEVNRILKKGGIFAIDYDRTPLLGIE